MPQTADNFICEICNFSCSKKYNYDKHIMTPKHTNRTIRTEKMSKDADICTYACVCDKIYKSRSSLWYHKKKCNQINSLTVTEDKCREPSDNSTILGLISQNKELMEMLQEQNKIIKELVPKVGNNNNNTTNNTNQFNLQVFLNEDCKDALNFSEFVETIQVSFSDLENQAENGYVKGISKLFIENLQSLGINKRPIHCTDAKRKTLYIKENGTWDKEGSHDTMKKGIQEVSRRTFVEFVKSKEDNAEAYKDADSEFSEKCLIIQRNLVPAYPRETTISKVIENITATSSIDKT